jgi:hypothetical protein
VGVNGLKTQKQDTAEASCTVVPECPVDWEASFYLIEEIVNHLDIENAWLWECIDYDKIKKREEYKEQQIRYSMLRADYDDKIAKFKPLIRELAELCGFVYEDY